MGQRRLNVTRAWAGAFGLLPWALAMALSLGIAGGGHGWIAPLVVSMPLVALYPLAFVRALTNGAGSIKADRAILLAALLLNLVLLGQALLAEPGYFTASLRFGAGTVALWFALWLGWQVLALVTLLRRRGAVS